MEHIHVFCRWIFSTEPPETVAVMTRDLAMMSPGSWHAMPSDRLSSKVQTLTAPSKPRCESWCWNIYLQDWTINMRFMEVTIAYMDHLGKFNVISFGKELLIAFKKRKCISCSPLKQSTACRAVLAFRLRTPIELPSASPMGAEHLEMEQDHLCSLYHYGNAFVLFYLSFKFAFS